MSKSIAIVAVLVSTTAFAVTKGEGVKFHEFPVPKHVQRQVWFWEGVFSRYGDRQVVIHDIDQPDLIVDLIDFDALKSKLNLPSALSRQERESVIGRYVERYQRAVESIRTNGFDAESADPMEKRVYKVFSRDPVALKRLLRTGVTLRSQTGLADEFQRAADIANQYLPYMERIFMRAQLPRDLTRLAFVESMFNLNATSKVGASGIWQFMPSTGKRFLFINRLVDERRSPIRATEAAARYMTLNYQKLGKWPLAIMAYNHGSGGVARAIREVGSDNIEDIILRYQSPSFGFASKNFYAEFIAARNIYNKFFHKGKSEDSNPLKIQVVTLPRALSYERVLQITRISESEFRKLNPSILPGTASRFRRTPLPAGLQIFVPVRQAEKISARLAQEDRKNPRARS
jgi:membrane-bound lytic murein transglycosylase D